MALDHSRHEEHAAAIDHLGGSFGCDLVAALGDTFDVPAFIRYLAAQTFNADTDGFLGNTGMNNFYLYRLENRETFVLISWDTDNTFWLNNLKDDPTEQKNLAEAMPDKVAELRAELAAIDAQQVKPSWPSLLESPIRIDQPMGTPFKAGEEYINWAN